MRTDACYNLHKLQKHVELKKADTKGSVCHDFFPLKYQDLARPQLLPTDQGLQEGGWVQGGWQILQFWSDRNILKQERDGLPLHNKMNNCFVPTLHTLASLIVCSINFTSIKRIHIIITINACKGEFYNIERLKKFRFQNY